MDLLIRGGRLLDGERADIAIDGGRIVGLTAEKAAEGAVEGAVEDDAAEVIDADGLVVAPGLVDAHRHTWQAPLRGIGADMTLPHYLDAVIRRVLPEMTADDVRRATLLGATEALDAGITTVFDWSHVASSPEHAEAVLDAYRTVGIRAVVAHTDLTADVAGLRGRITGALAVLGPEHGPWDETVRAVELARDLGVLVSAHVAAGPGSPVRRLHDAGLLGPHVQLVHLNEITAEDAKMLAGEGVRVVVTPVVEGIMGHGRSAYSRLAAAGARPGLGSDVVVNAPADLFEPLRATLLQHRLETGVMTPAADLLAAATVDAAHSIGLEGAAGTIAVGRPADLILLSGFGHVPGQAASAVVTTATPADVDTVIVDGRVLKRAGELVRETA